MAAIPPISVVAYRMDKGDSSPGVERRTALVRVKSRMNELANDIRALRDSSTAVQQDASKIEHAKKTSDK